MTTTPPISALDLQLTDAHIQKIKDSIPLLQAAGVEVTDYFYKRLFSHHPELQNIFNASHQASGKQSVALFSALAKVATQIDNVSALQGMVTRIANKHASLNVLPEHYPIVGHHLIYTLKELFPTAFTVDYEEAWTAAYQFLANTLMAKEQGIYQASRNQHGGWVGTRRFILAEKRIESALVTSFVFEPEDGLPVADYLPGQYLSIKVRVPDQEFEQIRQYSLSDKPNGCRYRISVKREGTEEAGVVSNYLHDDLNIGDVVELLPPAGDFVYQYRQTPDVFISAGVGLTPMQSMLEVLARQRHTSPLYYLHACENAEQHSFRRRLHDLTSTLDLTTHIWYRNKTDQGVSEHHGLMDLSSIHTSLPLDKGHFYLCGPISFMKFIKAQLQELDVDEARIHYEVFGPHDDF